MVPSTPQHPIHVAIDDIWKQGHTPRIQVDSRRDDVIVPESVRTKWGARLVLDLDASWPLNFEVGQNGIEVDLAFQGAVTRCTLPWAAIYVVLDRTTGRGIVIESHLPRGDEPLPSGQDETDTKRRVIKVADANIEAPDRKTPEPATPLAKTEAHKPESVRPGSTKSDTSETGKSVSDEEAKRRRATFKVIDGGG